MTTPRCNCENSVCETRRIHKAAGCKNSADNNIRCDYIGHICLTCAAHMPSEYIHVLNDDIFTALDIQFLKEFGFLN
jgi:hypothetical protein